MREELLDSQPNGALEAARMNSGAIERHLVAVEYPLSPNFGKDLNERQAEAKYGVYVGDFLWIGNEPVMAISDLGPEERDEYDRLFANFEPVPVWPYETVDEFVKNERPIDPLTQKMQMGTVNFLGFFQDPKSVTGMAHRKKMAWQRLEFLERNLEDFDLIAKLEPKMKGKTSMQDLDSETQELLFDAYNLMSNLVSFNDPDLVMTYLGDSQEGGEIYTAGDYLVR